MTLSDFKGYSNISQYFIFLIFDILKKVKKEYFCQKHPLKGEQHRLERCWQAQWWPSDFQFGGPVEGHGFGLGAFNRNNYRFPTTNHTMQVCGSDAYS